MERLDRRPRGGKSGRIRADTAGHAGPRGGAAAAPDAKGSAGVPRARSAAIATEAQRRGIFNYCHVVLHERAGVTPPRGPVRRVPRAHAGAASGDAAADGSPSADIIAVAFPAPDAPPPAPPSSAGAARASGNGNGHGNGNGNGHPPAVPAGGSGGVPGDGGGGGRRSGDASLTPRMRQTLEYLLDGDSEKQIAAKLRISRHTVHVYVKQLYRRFDVNSRGELFARHMGR